MGSKLIDKLCKGNGITIDDIEEVYHGKIEASKEELYEACQKIIKVVYHVLKDGVEYRKLGADYITIRQEKRRKSYLKKELEKLGYNVQILKSAV